MLQQGDMKIVLGDARQENLIAGVGRSKNDSLTPNMKAIKYDPWKIVCAMEATRVMAVVLSIQLNTIRRQWHMGDILKWKGS